MTGRATTFLFATLWAAGAARAVAQDSFADAGDLDAKSGLESATPTDNVNELGGNGNAGFGNNGNAGFGNNGNSPAGEDPGGFAIPDGDEGGGNGVFNDQPVDVGGGKNATSNPAFGAFGNDATGNAAAGKTPPVNPAAVPVNPAALPGGNIPVNTPVNTTPTNNGSAVPLNAAASEAPKPSEPEEPEITAPPLPPPNEFAGAPPVPGTMRLMAEGEAPEEYVVQPGDTLFDICDQLLSEPGYWPKLWALNPEIKNPHFIFPNTKLKFYPGDDETPPYLQVVSEDDVIPIDKGDLDENELVAEKVIFPQDDLAERPPIEVIGPEQVDALQDEILVAGKRYDASDVQLQVPGFIYQEEKEPLAFVLGGREGESSIAPGQRALIESVGDVSPGTLYTVLRAGEQVENPETGDLVGYKYYFVGNLKVDKKVEDVIYSGTMQSNNRLSIRPDDLIVPFISTNRIVPVARVGSLSAATANVVGFQDRGQDFSGQGEFVFLDKGNGDGISPGAYLPIYQTPGSIITAFRHDLPEDYEQVGVIRIIDTTDAGACGYIVKNVREIRTGDRTNKG